MYKEGFKQTNHRKSSQTNVDDGDHSCCTSKCASSNLLELGWIKISIWEVLGRGFTDSSNSLVPFKYILKKTRFWYFFLNLFISNVTFLYPLKTSENDTVFWCFQGMKKCNIVNKCSPFKRQSDKIVKHTQTIRRQQPANCLNVFDHFVGIVGNCRLKD